MPVGCSGVLRHTGEGTVGGDILSRGSHEPSPLLIFQPSWTLPFKYPMDSSSSAVCAVGIGMGGMGNALLEIQHSPTQASHFSPSRLIIPSSRVPPPLSSTPGSMNEAIAGSTGTLKLRKSETKSPSPSSLSSWFHLFFQEAPIMSGVG